MIAGFVVVTVFAAFVGLGFWQLGRLDDRRAENLRLSDLIEQESVPLAELVALPPTDLAFRRVVVGGVFDPSQEVLIRSQVYLGTAGFHVVTPLVLEDGTAILVNRGWVPLGDERVPVVLAPPPGGSIEVTGWLEPGEERPPLGPRDPEDGTIPAMSRIDIARIQKQTSHELLAVYIVEQGEQSESLPVRLDPPNFSDDGPHLAYAIQWFAFALIVIVGFAVLYRRSVQPSERPGTIS